MQKKTLIQVAVALVLFVGIGLAVFFLFSDNKSAGVSKIQSHKGAETVKSLYPGTSAVPMDAVMLLCCKSVHSALDLLGDNTAIYKELFCGTGKRGIGPFLDSLASPKYKKVNGPCTISMHYSRDLEPLVILSDCKDAKLRKRVLSLAGSCMLEAASAPDSAGTTVVVSSSQSLVAASVRHLQVGSSIMDDEKFTAAATITGGDDAIFFFCKYAPKLASLFLNKDLSYVGPFISSYADVVSLVPEKEKNGYRLTLNAACLGNPLYRVGSMDGGKLTVSAALPSETVFAVAMSTGGMSSYIEKYKNHLDANSKLSKYSDSAQKWAQSLDVREIAKAVLRYGDKLSQVLYIKTGSKPSADVILRDTGISSLSEYKTAVLPYAYSGYAATQFGDVFSIPEESYFFYRNGWLVIGDNKTLSELVIGDQEPLADVLSKAGVHLAESPAVYFDVSAYSEELANIFHKDRLARAVARTLYGTSGEVFAMSGNKMEVVRSAPAKSKTKADPSAVTIPAGPFTVTNSDSGKKNNLSQNPDNSIQLTDDKGKVLWTKPFPGKICGAVGETDYYNNKRIQFVVAIGTKLYMIDRLGRVVKDFPAELGKEVLLGPAIYDFSGAHGYSAMVLHVDNTIGLYDIHGRVRQGWKGIAPPEQIISLPELVTENGKKFWKVTTVSRVYTYPFNGGDQPVKKEKRKK